VAARAATCGGCVVRGGIRVARRRVCMASGCRMTLRVGMSCRCGMTLCVGVSGRRGMTLRIGVASGCRVTLRGRVSGGCGMTLRVCMSRSASVARRGGMLRGRRSMCGRGSVRCRGAGLFLGKDKSRNGKQERKQRELSQGARNGLPIHHELQSLKVSVDLHQRRKGEPLAPKPSRSVNLVLARKVRPTRLRRPFLTTGILGENVIKTLPDVQSFSYGWLSFSALSTGVATGARPTAILLICR
jgi:hypothetical protein